MRAQIEGVRNPAVDINIVRKRGLRCFVVDWSDIYDNTAPTRYGLRTRVDKQHCWVSENGALLLRDTPAEAKRAANNQEVPRV